MTVEFLARHYYSLLSGALAANELDECIYDELMELKVGNLDEQAEAYQRMITELDRKKLNDRIQRGAELIENEPDLIKKKMYIELYNDLILKLENLMAA